MATDNGTWGSDWAVGLHVWTERDGQALLGPGRVELLEGIDRWHSISEAARRMGMSYRHAWLLVQGANEAAGEPLVVTATGGPRGGGARLTEPGRRAVTVYRELQARLRLTAEGLWPRLARDSDADAVHVAAPGEDGVEALGELAAVLLGVPALAQRPPLLGQELRGDARALLGGDLHSLPIALAVPFVMEPAALAEGSRECR